MKAFVSLLYLTTCLLVGVKQNEIKKDYYKVDQIYTADKYYLIFLRKGDEKYTIYSQKGMNVYGKKVVQDSSYYFELITIPDTLINGKSIAPMNYMNTTYFGYFKRNEIGKLCTAKNLVGLVIPSPIPGSVKR